MVHLGLLCLLCLVYKSDIPFLSFRPSAPQEKYLHPLPTTALYIFADGNLSVIMVVAILGVSVSQ